MRGFRYKLTLRLVHPSMTMADITKGVGLAPEGGWDAGENRERRSGVNVEGLRASTSTYWYAEIDHAQDVELVEALDLQLSHLEKRKAFMTKFLSSGGSAEYFIGWFMTDNSSGLTLPSSLMGRVAAFDIDIGFDVYAADDRAKPAQP